MLARSSQIGVYEKGRMSRLGESDGEFRGQSGTPFSRTSTHDSHKIRTFRSLASQENLRTQGAEALTTLVVVCVNR